MPSAPPFDLPPQTDAAALGPSTARRRAPGRPTREEALHLRERFLDAALHSFLSKGFAGTSIDGLARETGVHKDTIYRQHGGKEQVYLAVVSRAMARLRDRLAAIELSQGDPEQVLLIFIRRIYDELTTPESVAVLSLNIAEARQFPELAQRLYIECGKENLSGLERYLTGLTRQGLLTLDDPAEAAGQLALQAVGGLEFLMMPPLATEEERDARARRVLRFLLRAWGYRAGSRNGD